jgi:hypothetical protein
MIQNINLAMIITILFQLITIGNLGSKNIVVVFMSDNQVLI